MKLLGTGGLYEDVGEEALSGRIPLERLVPISCFRVFWFLFFGVFVGVSPEDHLRFCAVLPEVYLRFCVVLPEVR